MKAVAAFARKKS